MNREVELQVYHLYKVEGLQRVGNKHDGGYVVHLPLLQFTEGLDFPCNWRRKDIVVDFF